VRQSRKQRQSVAAVILHSYTERKRQCGAATMSRIVDVKDYWFDSLGLVLVVILVLAV
jgi:hypothetical protein